MWLHMAHNKKTVTKDPKRYQNCDQGPKQYQNKYESEVLRTIKNGKSEFF